MSELTDRLRKLMEQWRGQQRAWLSEQPNYSKAQVYSACADELNALLAVSSSGVPSEAARRIVAHILISDMTPLNSHNERSWCHWCEATWTNPDWRLSPQPALFGHPLNDCLVWTAIDDQ